MRLSTASYSQLVHLTCTKLSIGCACFVLIIILSLAALNTDVHAQFTKDIRQGNADYPLPTAAAIYALHEIDPPLLEPSTVRNVTASIRSIWTNSYSGASMGLEFAPLLIGNNVDLSDYLAGRLIRVLLRTRISVAATQLQDHSINSAVGLRFMLHDDADLRADSSFQKTLIHWAEQSADIVAECRAIAGPDTLRYRACLTEAISKSSSIQQKLDSLREVMKEKLWNGSVVELASAALYHTQNANIAGGALTIRRYYAFIGAGFPMLGNSGQFMFGGSGWVGHSDTDPSYQREGSVIVRTYYGTASERFFIGAALCGASKFTRDFKCSVGGVLNITNGLWLQPAISTSLLKKNWTGTEAMLTLNFGTPEIHS
jgi:hypothetical protein